MIYFTDPVIKTIPSQIIQSSAAGDGAALGCAIPMPSTNPVDTLQLRHGHFLQWEFLGVKGL